MYKKFICLCLAICLVFTLAACNEQASQQGKNQTPEDDKNNVTTPKEKSVKLSFWDMAWGPPETYPPVVEKLVNKFEEENPNTEVEIQTIAWDNFYQTFLTAIASGTISDVATMGASLPIQFHSMGALEPLNSILDEWKQEGKYDDISQEDYDTFIFDGEVGAVPWQLDPRGFVYRKDVFEKVGISKMPEDWNDFLDILRKIKQNTEYIPFVFGGAGFHHHVAYQFQILNNSGMVTEDLKADMESERFVEVLEFINTLVKEGLIPEATVGYKQNEARKLYYSGKAAIMLDVMSAEILNYPEISDNSGVLPVFKAPNGIKASASWANPISVFKQSKNVSLAKKFVKWYSENNLPLFTETKFGKYPVRKSFKSDPYFKSNWLVKGVTKEVLPYSLPAFYPAKSYFPAYGLLNGERYAGVALQEVLVAGGNADCRAIAKRANDKAVKALEKNK